MSLDIEDRKIGGDHSRLREPGSFPALDPRGGRRLLRLRGDGADGGCKESENRREYRNGGSEAQTLGRTASFTVIFAFFRNSALYALIAFCPFSFCNAARICSLTIARGIFFPSCTIVAECSA